MQLAVTAQKFSQRPSQLLGIEDESIALSFDVKVAMTLHDHEQEEKADAEERFLKVLGTALNVQLVQEIGG